MQVMLDTDSAVAAEDVCEIVSYRRHKQGSPHLMIMALWHPVNKANNSLLKYCQVSYEHLDH